MSAVAERSEIFAPGVLDGHVALVTGGGTGLGRETARELARCGARVRLRMSRRCTPDSSDTALSVCAMARARSSSAAASRKTRFSAAAKAG